MHFSLLTTSLKKASSLVSTVMCIKGICFYGGGGVNASLGTSGALVTPERGHKRKSS